MFSVASAGNSGYVLGRLFLIVQPSPRAETPPGPSRSRGSVIEKID